MKATDQSLGGGIVERNPSNGEATGMPDPRGSVARLDALLRVMSRLMSDARLDLTTKAIGSMPLAEVLECFTGLQQLLTDTQAEVANLRDQGILLHDFAPRSTRIVELLALSAALGKDVDQISSEGTPEIIRASPVGIRSLCIEDIHIDHERQQNALAEVELAHMKAMLEHPSHLLLLGERGAGKTDTLTIHRDKYRDDEPKYATVRDHDYGDIRVAIQDVIVVEASSVGTPNAILRGVLSTVGDPDPASGTLDQQMHRLVRFLGYAQTRVLAIDDIHFAVQLGEDPQAMRGLRSRRAILSVSSMLRDLAAGLHLEHVPVSIVLSGLPSAVRLGLDNSQFTFRFAPVELSPYDFSREHPDEVITFLTAVNSFLALLPLREQDQLGEGDFDLLRRIHFACGGNIGNLAKLIRRAAQYALSLGNEKIALEHWNTAYNVLRVANELAAGGPRERQANPFHHTFSFPPQSAYRHVKSFRDLVVRSKVVS